MTDESNLWVVGTPERGRYLWLATRRLRGFLAVFWMESPDNARTFPSKADAEAFADDSTSLRTVAMRLVGARIASATGNMVRGGA